MTFTVAAGLPPPVPMAEMMVEPVVLELIVVLATPETSVVAVALLNVPRLAENVTVEPTTGAGLPQVREIGWFVLIGINRFAVGVVKAKDELLIASVWVLIAPAPLAVITSVAAALLAVTVAVSWPEESVVLEERATVLPFCEVTPTATPGSAFPPESLTLIVSCVDEFNVSELLPLMAMVVPVTATLFVPTAVPAVALIAIVRLFLFAPRFSFAVTTPLLSVVPLVELKYADGSLLVEKTTACPATVCPVEVNTIAVTSTVVLPEEGICVLLTSN